MILLSLIPFLTLLFPLPIFLLSLEFMKFRSYRLKSSMPGPDVFVCVLSGERRQKGKCLKVFLTAFPVAIVDIKILVMYMNGFLHAVLGLPTSASRRKPFLLGENSGLKEPTGRQEMPLWPGRRAGEKP